MGLLKRHYWSHILFSMESLIKTVRACIARTKPLQRNIERSISVSGLQRRPKVDGSVWGICLAKNEADIIEHTVRHFLRQGFDGLIVIDNGSTDGTIEILRNIAQTDDRLFIGEDREPAYHQGRKTSYLAHLAWKAGADWVVPFDADEQWFAPTVTVPEFLRASRAEVVECAIHDVYPALPESVLDLAKDRPMQIDLDPTGWVKVAFRARRWLWVEIGNHGVDSAGPRQAGLSLRHFQYRSLAHVTRKVNDGRAAVAMAFGDTASVASHWRELSQLSSVDLEARWVAHIEGQKTIEGSPSRPRVTLSDPEPWVAWDPNSRLQK